MEPAVTPVVQQNLPLCIVVPNHMNLNTALMSHLQKPPMAPTIILIAFMAHPTFLFVLNLYLLQGLRFPSPCQRLPAGAGKGSSRFLVHGRIRRSHGLRPRPAICLRGTGRRHRKTAERMSCIVFSDTHGRDSIAWRNRIASRAWTKGS